MLYEEQFTLSVTLPFRLDYTVWALRRRQKNLIDKWDGKKYARVFVIDGNAVQVTIEQKNETKLAVTVRSEHKLPGIEKTITNVLRRMLGIDKNLDGFYKLAGKDQYLKTLASSFQGVKPPRFASIFEALINAIACQQVTLDLGVLLLNRLAESYGKKFADQHAFPRPEDLIDVPEDDLKSLGFSYQKSQAIISLAKSIINREISFDNFEDLPNEIIVTRLMEIKGIGRWSAEYMLLRGLGRIDTFPGDDVGAQKNLMLLMKLQEKPNYDEIKQVTKQWNPYAGFVYFHLLLDKLQKKNLL
ncbi:MAG TPA: AlkA N-terminal domain-containing protein [Patescibacteria group bacterium]|nr:AlkA N-terminal domain-containing protein [Patescibacteria group bacterium]